MHLMFSTGYHIIKSYGWQWDDERILLHCAVLRRFLNWTSWCRRVVSACSLWKAVCVALQEVNYLVYRSLCTGNGLCQMTEAWLGCSCVLAKVHCAGRPLMPSLRLTGFNGQRWKPCRRSELSLWEGENPFSK